MATVVIQNGQRCYNSVSPFSRWVRIRDFVFAGKTFGIVTRDYEDEMLLVLLKHNAAGKDGNNLKLYFAVSLWSIHKRMLSAETKA